MSTIQKPPRKSFIIHAGIGVMVIFALAACISPSDRQANATTRPYNVTSKPTTKPTYLRLSDASKGESWPVTSGYVKGHPKKLRDGLSTLTVDNSKNDSDVFTKLYSLETVPPQPVRFFFIKRGDQFTVENIRAGNYDVRYQELDTGALFRSEPFKLIEKQLEGETRFSKVTMTLYKVPSGNMQTYPLSEAEF